MHDHDDDEVMAGKAREARQSMFDALDYHEATHHDGEPCPSERLGIIAFLAHAAGLQVLDMPWLAEVLAEYELTHDELHANGNGSG